MIPLHLRTASLTSIERPMMIRFQSPSSLEDFFDIEHAGAVIDDDKEYLFLIPVYPLGMAFFHSSRGGID